MGHGLVSAVAVAAVGCSITTADADMVAAWNFNGVKPVDVVESTVGKGWIDLSGVGGDATLFSGTTTNAFEEWRAGEALGLRGSDAGGTFLLATSITPGLGGFPVEASLSFATRRSHTGFASLRVESWTGSAWNTIETVEVGMDWASTEMTWWIPGSATDLQLRFTPLDAVAGSGTFRLDNVILEASPVPAPGAIGLVGLAGAVARGGRGRRVSGVMRRA